MQLSFAKGAFGRIPTGCLWAPTAIRRSLRLECQIYQDSVGGGHLSAPVFHPEEARELIDAACRDTLGEISALMS